jgi:uncharacterized protein
MKKALRGGAMKYTLCITQQCNLNCSYCYIGKKGLSMPLDIAAAIVDFIFERTPPQENIDIGFFGGEPILEFDLIKLITSMIKSHRLYDAGRVTLSMVTNGTLFSQEIAEFIYAQEIEFCISCDGPPPVQDCYRRFRDGRGSSAAVEETIRKAVNALPTVVVNAVYTPVTVSRLSETVEYFSQLGLKRLFLSPDYSATWTKEDIDSLEHVYGEVAGKYVEHYLLGKPLFINIIDNKITVILRGGYQQIERCRMGTGELAFAPSGNIYPCERFIGGDDGSSHCIGNMGKGMDLGRMSCHTMPGGEVNAECTECGIRDYCMNWCGCSNYFSSGYYNRVSSFLCASEQMAVKTAFGVFQELERELGGVFIEHLSGRPYANVFAKKQEKR